MLDDRGATSRQQSAVLTPEMELRLLVDPSSTTLALATDRSTHSAESTGASRRAAAPPQPDRKSFAFDDQIRAVIARPPRAGFAGARSWNHHIILGSGDPSTL